jgi:hypothetical protein
MSTNLKVLVEWGITIVASVLIGWIVGWFWGGLSFMSSVAITLLMKGFERGTSHTPLPGVLILIATCVFSHLADHIVITSLDGGANVWEKVNSQELRHCKDYADLGVLLSENDKKLSQSCINKRSVSIDVSKGFRVQLSEYTSFWGTTTSTGMITFYLFVFARALYALSWFIWKSNRN